MKIIVIKLFLFYIILTEILKYCADCHGVYKTSVFVRLSNHPFQFDFWFTLVKISTLFFWNDSQLIDSNCTSTWLEGLSRSFSSISDPVSSFLVPPLFNFMAPPVIWFPLFVFGAAYRCGMHTWPLGDESVGILQSIVNIQLSIR